jgi:hypothetical protein
MPVILASWEAEIRRITLQDQPQAKSSQDLISTNKKAGCGGMHLSSQLCHPGQSRHKHETLFGK